MLADDSSPPRAAFLLALLLGTGFLALALLSPWRVRTGPFVALFLALSALHMLALALWLRRRGGRWRIFLLATGLAFRLVVGLLHPPDLSLDVARYAWDGYLATQGISPFAHPPAAPELLPLRTEFFSDISHKEIRTIYPPLAQALFALAAFMQPGTGMIRVLLIAVDVCVLLLLAALLRRTGLPDGHLLVYAWSPLPVVEIASSAHVEPLGVMALLLTALALAAARPFRAGAAFACAVMAKVVPIMTAPLLLRRGGWKATLAAAATGSLLLAPYLSEGSNLIAGLGEYAGRWRANDFLFAGLEAILPTTVNTRYLVMVLIAAYAGVRALRPDREGPVALGFLRDAARVLLVALLLVPTLHPWYLLWVLPLLTFAPSPAWLLLCGTVVMSYLDMASGHSPLLGPSWVVWCEMTPPLLLAAWLALRYPGGLLAGGVRCPSRGAVIKPLLPPRDGDDAGHS